MTTNYTGFLALSGSASDTAGDSSTYSGTFGVTLTATLDAVGSGTATETVGGATSVLSYSYNYTPTGNGTGGGTVPFSFVTPTLVFQQGTFQSGSFKIPIKVGNTYFYGTMNGSITNQGKISEQLVGTIGGRNSSNIPFTGTIDGNATLACFLRGTKIMTIKGPIAVESLATGDVVTLSAGGAGRISWIGERGINCGLHPDPETVWPVQIAAGAFGPGLPERDLYLSPDHAIFVNDVLVPVKHLMNGTSIAQAKLDRVQYFHLELERHEVILAEGLPVESYLDTGDRANFRNCDTLVRLNPDFTARLGPDTAMRWEMHGAAPLVQSGPDLVAARAVVLERIVSCQQAHLRCDYTSKGTSMASFPRLVRTLVLLLVLGLCAAASANAAQSDLVSAAEAGDLAQVKALIAAHTDVNTKGRYGATALHVASFKGYVEEVRSLLIAGANVNARMENGATPLIAASQNGQLEVVRTLLGAGADVNAKNDAGIAALSRASAGGYLQIVQALIAAHADVNAKASAAAGKGVGGITALMLASAGGHVDVAKALIAAHADVNAKTTEGTTAYSAATKRGALEVQQILLAAHADVNAGPPPSRIATAETTSCHKVRSGGGRFTIKCPPGCTIAIREYMGGDTNSSIQGYVASCPGQADQLLPP